MLLKKISFPLLIFILLGFCMFPCAFCLFKLTNAICIALDPTWVRVNECRLRALRRDVTEINVNVSLLQTAHDAMLNAYFVKKANGYKPFLYNCTFDGCKYLKSRNNPIRNLIFDMAKDYTNLNHTCPYSGDILFRNFYLKHEMLNLPLADGDYGLIITWIVQRRSVCLTRFYFSYTNRN